MKVFPFINYFKGCGKKSEMFCCPFVLNKGMPKITKTFRLIYFKIAVS